VSGAGGPRGQSERWDHRQSKCEEHRKRGATIDLPSFDAGKQVKGKKRHLLVDTLGLVLHAIVHPANVQDRDGGMLLLRGLADRFPLLVKLFADGAYQGPRFCQALAQVWPQLKITIIMRSEVVLRSVDQEKTVSIQPEGGTADGRGNRTVSALYRVKP
jgi:hypothetical protein